MKKRNVLLTALSCIAICASLIVGTTYALFTSESKVDVSVTSGKVDVTAVVDKDSVQTKDLNSEYALGLNHALGDSIAITDDSVVLNNIACGDGIKFNIVITNNSTIEVKYRTVISAAADQGLFNALNVEIGNGVVYDGTKVYSTWKVMDVKTEITTIAIELPNVGNEYQGKKCSFNFTVEAVQANAATTDGMVHIGEGETRKDFLTLPAAIEAASDGDVIYLDEDVTVLNQIRITKPLVLDGNNHTLTVKYDADDAIYAKSSGVEFRNITLDCYSPSQAGMTLDGAYMYTLDNVVVQGASRHSSIRFENSSGGILNDCEVSNSMSPENTFYNKYGMPMAAGIFTNRNTKLSGQTEEGEVKLELNNTKVSSLVVNGSSTNYLLPKTFVNEGTHIDFVFYGSTEVPATRAIVFDGGEADKVFAPYAYEKNVGLYRDMKYLDQVAYAITNANGLSLFAELVNTGVLNQKDVLVYLDEDIDLEGIDWAPIGSSEDNPNKFFGTFDGRGHTISNLKIDTTKEVKYQATGLFGALSGTVKNLVVSNANVKGLSAPNSAGNTANGIAVVAGSIYPSGSIDNVKVLGSTVSGNRYVAGISGYTYGNVDNCTVLNTTITATPDKLHGGKYDNGDKVGGIVGYLNDDKHTLTGNTVKGCTISAWRDLGGIGGCVAAGTNVTFLNNTVSGNDLIFVENPEYIKEHNNMGNLIGRNTGNAVLDASNKVEE